MKIQIKKLTDTAKVPAYAHEGDVGIDIFSDETVTIMPGQREQIKSGVAIQFEPGYAALVWDKGSIGIGKGLKVMGGVFDAGYRGDYTICLHNLSDQPQTIEQGDKIAQIVFQKVEIADIELVDELSDTARGQGRLGSTGSK
jgi:dUTP pyrophosphatase